MSKQNVDHAAWMNEARSLIDEEFELAWGGLPKEYYGFCGGLPVRTNRHICPDLSQGGACLVCGEALPI